VHQRPAYRAAFRYRRCLIPAEGFFEWRQTEAGKQPYFITCTDQAPFAMAGLWEHWQAPDGTEIRSCAIIVTDANGAVLPVHDRMPVILPRDAHAAWLDSRTQDSKELRPLLKPYPAQLTALTPVSKRVNNARNDDPELLQRDPAD
jgi:putative SOS response-associated peptidase YedK